jgi:hypothetical protein
MSLSEKDRALVEALSRDLQAYADGCVEARYWGGPTMYPAHPINEDRARHDAKALTALLAAAREEPRPPQEGAEPVALEALLKDPNAVHLNMLRGGIAKLTPAQIGHLYRGDEAEEVIREVRRQNPPSQGRV